ncbi:MAG TPA: hypothetical protein VMI13_05445 [Solirubrobacteraceae bacterium]|nr:hypothetical protein [Solirubrobacteraceae bacterium]
MGRKARVVASLLGALTGIVMTLALAPASQALFTQCPPVDKDAGCQFLITVTNAGSSIAEDATQPPYEGEDDALIGVQNSSSMPIAALPLEASGLFSFEQDGLCDPGSPPVPSGCVPVPGTPAGTTCAGGGGYNCSFAPPPGEPANTIEPQNTVGPAWPNGDHQNGYEGPTSWFTVPPQQFTQGTVNFSPAIAPGASTYFSLESPPSASALKVGTPSATPGGSTGGATKLPPAFGPQGAIQGLPSPKACLSKRHFKIHIKRYKGISYVEAIVFINKKQTSLSRARNGQFTSPINLRGLPKGTVVVKITVITSSGGIIVGKRVYHTCHKKLRGPGHHRL